MFDINVKPEKVAEEVRRLAESDPDFDYRAQRDDSDDGMPSYLGRAIDDLEGRPCIIGQALQNLGVPESALQRVEGLSAGDFFDCKLPEVKWMEWVQEGQDTGQTWGVAVEVADSQIV